MGRHLDALRETARNDRGSLAMAVVIWAPVVVLLMAFLVDVGLLISDRTQASDLADQAARRVAQEVDLGWLTTRTTPSGRRARSRGSRSTWTRPGTACRTPSSI